MTDPAEVLEDAAGIVRSALLSVLPPGVPPSFRSIAGARFDGAGRSRNATADLIMFDGQPATVEVDQSAEGLWRHRWLSLPGGSVSWEGGRWVRRPKDVASKEVGAT